MDSPPVHEWLSDSYFDFHGTRIETRDSTPTALEFSRLVHLARPVVFKNATLPRLLHDKWTNEYLISIMRDEPISVAVTPHGRADSVVRSTDKKLYFAEPHIETMTMNELLSSLGQDGSIEEIRYLQSQNGNVYSAMYFSDGPEASPSEFESLREDIPSDVPWCSEALDSMPDAVNLWIGDDKSVTTIHSDPYENIYQVIRGRKLFTLLPPTDSWALQERTYSHAQYNRPSKGNPLQLTPSSDDPNVPGALPPNVHALQVVLDPGDTLFLPAGWWHFVRQSGLTIALNYWYDTEMGTLSWLMVRMLRETKTVPLADECDDEDI
ncbi:cupin-like domain-containing protein [Flagelloscypha sp. PMI_526]|nr:cupin-like domain-containing protein [Flagelloscypha sp. PMI_526]